MTFLPTRLGDGEACGLHERFRLYVSIRNGRAIRIALAATDHPNEFRQRDELKRLGINARGGSGGSGLPAIGAPERGLGQYS